VAALHELQRAMRDAILGEGAPAVLADAIAPDGIDPAARVAIYRHHVLTTLTAVLEAAYPVVCRLVDRRFFGYAADRYKRAHPPAGPCLTEYGDRFAEFLAGFPPCRGVPYLPDVARLEWALHAARHAPDAPALEPERLARVDPGDLPAVVFRMEPSVALLASRWPVDRIWRANQDGAPAAVDLDGGGAALEVRRVDGAAGWRALDLATHAFRRSIAGGATLGAAAAAAGEADPRFDLARAIRDLLDERILTDLRVSNQT
jgi:hypothetical protein